MGQWLIEDLGEDPGQLVCTLTEDLSHYSIWSGGLGAHRPQCAITLCSYTIKLELLQCGGQVVAALGPSTSKRAKKKFFLTTILNVISHDMIWIKSRGHEKTMAGNTAICYFVKYLMLLNTKITCFFSSYGWIIDAFLFNYALIYSIPVKITEYY